MGYGVRREIWMNGFNHFHLRIGIDLFQLEKSKNQRIITKNQKLTEKQKTLPDILTENRLNRYFCITKKNTDESY